MKGHHHISKYKFLKLYRYDGKAVAVTVKHSAGNGRILIRITNGGVIAVESSLKRFTEQLQKNNRQINCCESYVSNRDVFFF